MKTITFWGLVTWLLSVVVTSLFGAVAYGVDYQIGEAQRQEGHYGGAVVEATPTGQLIYVNSVTGVNGNSGADRRHPLNTLAYAISVASAGDTIILNPGGSETVTATLAASTAYVKIICPVSNPDSGFTVTGAGTVDLLTVSAADVHIAGLKFVHTGTTTTTAGILTTAAADRLCVENCVFDDTAITTTWTGYGLEITDDCDDVSVYNCRFKDNHRGVMFTNASAKNLIDCRISGSTFWVGQATAFGIHCSPTGTVRGLEIIGCAFIEADGDGTAATDAWDGSDGTNAASGPILMGAACDQYIIANCTAYTALSATFSNIQAINAGAAGGIVDCANEYGIETLIGSIDATTTDSLHGKLGTDTELADNSLYDLLGVGSKTLAISASVGSSVDGTTTDTLHGKIGTDVEMADSSLWDLLIPVASAGTTDIDISEADYTTYITLLTITPASGGNLMDVSIDFDWNKATTGWDTICTAADTLDIAVLTKVDGTNWRTVMTGTQVTANGDGTLDSTESGERFNVGMVGNGGAVRVEVKLSIERDDVEIPYRVHYRGAAPTVTAVAAG